MLSKPQAETYVLNALDGATSSCGRWKDIVVYPVINKDDVEFLTIVAFSDNIFLTIEEFREWFSSVFPPSFISQLRYGLVLVTPNCISNNCAYMGAGVITEIFNRYCSNIVSNDPRGMFEVKGVVEIHPRYNGYLANVNLPLYMDYYNLNKHREIMTDEFAERLKMLTYIDAKYNNSYIIRCLVNILSECKYRFQFVTEDVKIMGMTFEDFHKEYTHQGHRVDICGVGKTRNFNEIKELLIGGIIKDVVYYKDKLDPETVRVQFTKDEKNYFLDISNDCQNERGGQLEGIEFGGNHLSKMSLRGLVITNFEAKYEIIEECEDSFSYQECLYELTTSDGAIHHFKFSEFEDDLTDPSEPIFSKCIVAVYDEL